MAENLQHKVYFHEKRFGKFTRGKKRRLDDDLTEYAKENKCNAIAEVRIFVHRGYPVKNIKATRIAIGVEVSTGKSNFNVLVKEDKAEITGPDVGTELEMRIVNKDPCFWLIGKRKFVKKDESKVETQKKETKLESEPAEVEKPTNTINGDAKKTKKKTKQQQMKQKKHRQKQKQQQGKKNKRKRKASQKGKAGKKRKFNNVGTKNEASRSLIEQLASKHEDSKRKSLKKSHERVGKFEDRLQKKEYLSKRKKMRMLKTKTDFSDLHEKQKKKGKRKKGKGRKVQFAV